MKSYWYIVAFSALISALTIYLHTLLFFISFFMWLTLLYLFKRLKVLPISVATLFLLLFLVHFTTGKDKSVLQHEPVLLNESVLTGQIIGQSKHTDKKLEFVFREQTMNSDILIVLFIKNQQIPSQSEINQLKHGATCQIEGTLSSPDGATNPGQFDYRAYLYNKGINYQLILQSIENVTCHGSSFLQGIYNLRTYLTDYTEEKLTATTNMWLHALIFGESMSMEPDIIEQFQRWGLSHILAISGLHTGIILSLIYFVLVKLSIMTKEKAHWLIILFLPLFALLAGGEPSVWRASLMVFIFLIMNKLRLDYQLSDILSIVFLILIIVNKHIIFHIGFQFSFIVTFSLILSSSFLTNKYSRIYVTLLISFVAQMVILPLQLHYFSVFQPLSILLNIIVIPYFSFFVIPFMFLILFLLPFPHIFTQFLDQLFSVINQTFLTILQVIDNHLYFPLLVGELSIYHIIIYYIIFVILMKQLEIQKLDKALKSGVMIVLFILGLTLRPYFSPIGIVTMLDMGQGDTFIIELPYRKGVFFIDAGATFSFPDFEPTDYVAKHIIQPYLNKRSIYKIDTIFISHDHFDHFGSIPYLIEHTPIDEIIISPYFEFDGELDKALKENDVKISLFKSFKNIKRNGQHFYVLSPGNDKYSSNENSHVLFTRLGGLSWLFTGDIGKETERELMLNYKNIDVDVLKVGHHGSNTSTDPQFIEAIRPKYALISAGRNNVYGHPTDDVINTLKEHDVTIFRTDEDGATQYFFKGEKGIFKQLFKD